MVVKYDPMNRCVLLLLAVSTTERSMFNVPVESDVPVESATPSKCSGWVHFPHQDHDLREGSTTALMGKAQCALRSPTGPEGCLVPTGVWSRRPKHHIRTQPRIPKGSSTPLWAEITRDQYPDPEGVQVGVLETPVARTRT